MTSLPASLNALAAPCPPMLEAAAGSARRTMLPCTGSRAATRPATTTGRSAATGPRSRSWRSPATRPSRPGWRRTTWAAPTRRRGSGCSSTGGRDVGPRADVAAVLCRQHGWPEPAEPSEPVSPELLAALAEIPFEEVRVDQGRLAALVRARMERQARQVDELVGWLDARAAGRW
jgi:hypothetical protein